MITIQVASHVDIVGQVIAVLLLIYDITKKTLVMFPPTELSQCKLTVQWGMSRSRHRSENDRHTDHGHIWQLNIIIVPVSASLLNMSILSLQPWHLLLSLLIIFLANTLTHCTFVEILVFMSNKSALCLHQECSYLISFQAIRCPRKHQEVRQQVAKSSETLQFVTGTD